MEFCNTENENSFSVIQSGYYNHGKCGRTTSLLLISVPSALFVVFKKFILDILWNQCISFVHNLIEVLLEKQIKNETY
ncbi:hypothetical protein MSBRW_0260 [Methanosarcina barkeri str. Wiesmoor]|uniref:Uncharacterized protein n=1 Tax=Methanosarcina barkeri str. Wiesmoor TaxID=1434109 RepID=A0A0E3QHW7_METBA|nr:hypothetical protein MSBRW_0260 [Methanosarcina barkeri str. Wiesmoor]